MKLNTEQELAANHVDGPCLVTACPGSGKTRTVVERTARLIGRGIKPSSIMCITFTNKAANEMRERIEKSVGADIAKRIWISTFHRLGSFILRKQGHWLGYGHNLTICQPDDQIDLICQCARQLEHEISKPQANKIAWQVNDWRENLEDEPSLRKRLSRLGDDAYRIGREYLDRLAINNTIDFTGMLSETVRLLEKKDFPDAAASPLEKLQNHFHYFQIDEVQDTNLAQFRIMELLARKSRNILSVGDIDQSIYGWRGARSENIQDYLKLYPDCRIVKLGKNYRSTPQIIKVADKLIRHNPGRIAADFSTDNPSGAPVACHAFETPDKEALYVAGAIRQMVQTGKYKKKDFAIFYRLNSMSRALEMAMMNKAVPYNVVGNFSFFDRKEVKDAVAMLKLFCNPKDGVSFHRIANKPKRHIGDVAVGKIEMFAKNNTDGNIMEACKQVGQYLKSDSVQDGAIEVVKAFEIDSLRPPQEILSHLLTQLRYREYLAAEAKDDAERLDREGNLTELINDAGRFHSEGKGGVQEYLESICLMTDADEEQEEDAVTLMSAHSSKGLEFPVVFVVGVEQGILPHARAVEEREDGLEEERRLCYVAVTRAQKILCLSYCQKRPSGAYAGKHFRYQTAQPSQFLFEMELIKQDKTKSDAAKEKKYIDSMYM
jgi:DNA helicase-2/ATP-dependent DNA helicase PcrA